MKIFFEIRGHERLVNTITLKAEVNFRLFSAMGLDWPIFIYQNIIPPIIV